ncbi:MAG: hypothetical protein KR126chlam6_00969 [Candidatus Anoxychlamydiales bacterium]|nr:hypothetical protein [Candidatus Anoxychlamydiales bacterium]
MAIGDVKQDFIDFTTNHFTKNPRETFKLINYSTFWIKHFQTTQNYFIHQMSHVSSVLKSFPRVFDAFNLVDMMGNLNDVRNYFLGKKIFTNLADQVNLFSDTVNSICETTAWAVAVKAVTLTSYYMSWVTALSGATLMLSFSNRIFSNISDLKEAKKATEPEEIKEKKINQLSLAKNVSLFAIGVILFANGWFAVPMNAAALAIFSLATVISEFRIQHLKKENPDPNEPDPNPPKPALDPARVAVASAS